MRISLLIVIACLSSHVLASEVRDIQSSNEQVPSATTLSYQFTNWKAINRSWILSLAGSRDCEAILENQQGKLELVLQNGRVQLSLNGKPLRILQKAEVTSSRAKGPDGVERETLWLSLPDWVSLQIQLFSVDQNRQLQMSVFRQHSQEPLIPILEAIQN